MSLSVERLKELLAYETEWLAMFDHAALVRGMADLETRAAALHRDAAKAYSELLAIKEAEPELWLADIFKDDPESAVRACEFSYWSIPLIRKPE